MVIREAGILFRGFTLAQASYHKTTELDIDNDLRSSLMTALVNFAEGVFSVDSVEYFEMKKFVISFIKDRIKPSDSDDPESIITYAILDKEKKLGKIIKKMVRPSLTKIVHQFKLKYDGKNLSEISQFRDFKQELDNIFGTDTKTIEQKLKGTFF
ncbi:MAG: hypothetical protein EU540_05385 [Promethearchaeota archaeon]|nr:MAG: hypothetical protein EU540_05385 [Candidatus Lokiarchaeota archaeon]